MGKLAKLLPMAVLVLCADGVALAAPRLVIDEPVYAAGELPQGRPCVHDFVLRNGGDAVLTFRVKACCGAQASIHGGTQIEPGGQKRVTVEIDTIYRSGDVIKDIPIETNDPDNLISHVTMRARVVEELVIKPVNLNLGVLDAGVEYKRFVKVSNLSGRPLKITGITLRPERVMTLDGAAGFVLAPGEERQIGLRFKSDEPVGKMFGMIVLNTDIDYLPTKTARVMAVVRRVTGGKTSAASQPVE